MKTDRTGSITISFVVGMVVLLGLAALAIDIGYLYTVRAQLQNAADSGALAGAKTLVEAGSDVAYSVAKSYAEENVAAGENVILAPGDVSIGFYDFNSRSFFPDNETVNAIQVIARCTKDSPRGSIATLCARVMGFETADVSGQAIGIVDRRVTGIRPRDTNSPLLPFAVDINEVDPDGDGSFDIGRIVDFSPQQLAEGGNFGTVYLGGDCEGDDDEGDDDDDVGDDDDDHVGDDDDDDDVGDDDDDHVGDDDDDHVGDDDDDDDDVGDDDDDDHVGDDDDDVGDDDDDDHVSDDDDDDDVGDDDDDVGDDDDDDVGDDDDDDHVGDDDDDVGDDDDDDVGDDDDDDVGDDDDHVGDDDDDVGDDDDDHVGDDDDDDVGDDDDDDDHASDYDNDCISTDELREFVLSGYPNDFEIPTEDGHVNIVGKAGLSNGLEEDLEARLGDTVILLVYDRLTENGPNANFRIVRIVAVQLVDMDFSGESEDQYIRAQIVDFSTHTAITKPGAPENNSISKVRLGM